MMRLRIRNARTRVLRLREALLSPDPAEIGLCLEGLQEAVRDLQGLEAEWQVLPAGEPAAEQARLELEALRRDLCAATRLIECGAAFHLGWARLLGAAAAGYTAQGSPGELTPARSVSLQG
jgi:hypothetical protein